MRERGKRQIGGISGKSREITGETRKEEANVGEGGDER